MESPRLRLLEQVLSHAPAHTGTSTYLSPDWNKYLLPEKALHPIPPI